MALLKDEYSKKLPEKINRLTVYWAKIILQTASEQERQDFYSIIHHLAGAASVFGYPEVSRIAGRLQELIFELIEKKKALAENEKKEVEDLLVLLQKQVS